MNVAGAALIRRVPAGLLGDGSSILTDGHSKLAVEWKGSVCPYAQSSIEHISVPAYREDQEPLTRSVTIDLFRGIGGTPQRALIGGMRSAASDGLLTIELPLSGRTVDRSPVHRTGLLGGALIAGLPEDFAQPVPAGLLHWSAPAGRIIIQSAAYSSEQSSYRAFRAATAILSILLHASSTSLSEAEERHVRQLMHADADR